MSQSDKSNKVERVWHDPPMINDDPPEVFTLGAGVSPEIRKSFELLERSYKRSRLTSMITIASSFTVIYAVMSLVPDATTVDILNGFIAMTVVTIAVEIGRYYKIV